VWLAAPPLAGPPANPYILLFLALAAAEFSAPPPCLLASTSSTASVCTRSRIRLVHCRPWIPQVACSTQEPTSLSLRLESSPSHVDWEPSSQSGHLCTILRPGLLLASSVATAHPGLEESSPWSSTSDKITLFLLHSHPLAHWTYRTSRQ